MSEKPINPLYHIHGLQVKNPCVLGLSAQALCCIHHTESRDGT